MKPIETKQGDFDEDKLKCAGGWFWQNLSSALCHRQCGTICDEGRKRMGGGTIKKPKPTTSRLTPAEERLIRATLAIHDWEFDAGKSNHAITRVFVCVDDLRDERRAVRALERERAKKKARKG